MGPSGSGKSTFMTILGCLDTPTAGRYLLEGRDVSEPRRRRAVGRSATAASASCSSSSTCCRGSRAQANVELPLLYSDVPAASGARTGAGKLRGGRPGRAGPRHRPAQLSGGEQQRVAIARALVNDPILLLADEPTGNLDTRTSVEIMAVIQELHRGGLTIVLVTHEPDIAQYAQRILTFRDGQLMGDDAVRDPLEARPSSQRCREGRRHEDLGHASRWRSAPCGPTSCGRRSPRSGVIIGVGAVVTMMAIGAGAQARVAEQIRSLGLEPHHRALRIHHLRRRPARLR